jgi:nucleoside-diphosphate-sugar epimerase
VNGTTIVLGATGGFGGAVTRELLGRGRAVRALVRDPARAKRLFPPTSALELVHGDALDADILTRAAAGCGTIVHGVNYRYDEWSPFMPRVTTNVIAAASAAQATILFPGNIFGLGAPGAAPFDETVIPSPNSRKGALRVALEEALRRGAETEACRILVLRGGAYFGPTVRNDIVNMIFARAAAGKPMTMFGNLDLPHQWAYTPDLARCAVDLLDRSDRLAAYEVVHFAGHVVPSQRAFLAMIAARAGYPGLAIRDVRWQMVENLSVRQAGLRELVELRHIYEDSLILDDPRRRQLLPNFIETSVEQAVTETLASYRAESQTSPSPA